MVKSRAMPSYTVNMVNKEIRAQVILKADNKYNRVFADIVVAGGGGTTIYLWRNL